MQEPFLLLGPVTVCTDVSGGGSPRRSLTLLGSREGRSSNWGRGRSRDQSHFLISFGLSFVSRVKNKVGGWGIGAGTSNFLGVRSGPSPLPPEEEPVPEWRSVLFSVGVSISLWPWGWQVSSVYSWEPSRLVLGTR